MKLTEYFAIALILSSTLLLSHCGSGKGLQPVQGEGLLGGIPTPTPFPTGSTPTPTPVATPSTTPAASPTTTPVATPTTTPVATPTTTPTPLPLTINDSSGEGGGTTDDMAIDGNINTFWNSGTGFEFGAQYIKFDLGGPQNINLVRIRSGATNNMTLTLFFHASCNDIAVEEDHNFTGVTNGQWLEITVNRNGVRCLSVDRKSSNPGPSSLTFYEVEIYKKP